MKLSYSSLLVTVLLGHASALKAPMERYGVIIPEWEVEVTPGGHKTVLRGTVEEVHEELRKLNPDYDEQFINNSTASELSERDSDTDLVRRTDFSGSKYHCRGWLKTCKTWAIRSGIETLRHVKGKPKNGPGPGNCGRVSCSYNSAIWWCNQNAETKELDSFSDIADGAAFVVEKCYKPDSLPHYPGQENRISGYAHHRGEGWSVIVNHDQC
ncbi:hypothetical protein FLONG3_5063 [Fusarium longipes]|uniref:Secreted in xylem 1 n=1 Tax=Fusarium longipes TaxID=694270 RepID=A0A395SWE8_9HYPO|nr:hypothetical protein FLONG3_5063 [Fusarium longipes]